MVERVVCRSVKSQKLVISVNRPRSLPRYTVSGFMAKEFYCGSSKVT